MKHQLTLFRSDRISGFHNDCLSLITCNSNWIFSGLSTVIKCPFSESVLNFLCARYCFMLTTMSVHHRQRTDVPDLRYTLRAIRSFDALYWITAGSPLARRTNSNRINYWTTLFGVYTCSEANRVVAALLMKAELCY